jgi:signal transduction histidine kinase
VSSIVELVKIPGGSPISGRCAYGVGMRTRARRLVRPLADVAAAGAIVAIFWVAPAAGADSWPRAAAGAVLAAAVFGSMVLRGRMPFAATMVTGIATVLGHVLGVCQDPMLATAWCLYPLAIERARRTGPVVVGLAGFLVFLALVTGVREETAQGLGRHLIIATGALGVAWMLGVATGRQIAAAREAERMRVQLEVARDVHDVVGHGLGVIIAQSGVVLSLPDADGAELRETLADVADHARTALEEVQTMVRTLRAMDGGAAPGLDRLPAVVAATRAAGIDVDVREEAGEAAVLAYRIVQEALSNVVRHAPGASCAVDVYEDGGDVVVRVRDDGPRARPGGTASASTPAGSGVGLRGMRERARLIGGTVTWGARSAGGFEVEARLPVRGGS